MTTSPKHRFIDARDRYSEIWLEQRKGGAYLFKGRLLSQEALKCLGILYSPIRYKVVEKEKVRFGNPAAVSICDRATARKKRR